MEIYSLKPVLVIEKCPFDLVGLNLFVELLAVYEYKTQFWICHKSNEVLFTNNSRKSS